MRLRLGQREVTLSTKTLAQLWRVILMVPAALRHFERPFRVLMHYVRKTSPEDKEVRLRNRLKVFLSSCSDDVITVVIIFCRREYGDVRRGSTVIDIGANIGAFSLYAACMGAAKVFAFEPNREAYGCLVANITENGFEDRITPSRQAVADRDDEYLRISRASSPYNSAVRCGSNEYQGGDCDLVTTISLTSILRNNSIDHVDLLKMDCEGGEYDIILGLTEATLSKITDIRIEYHGRGRKDPIIRHLKEHGFSLERLQVSSDLSGNMWFSAGGRCRPPTTPGTCSRRSP